MATPRRTGLVALLSILVLGAIGVLAYGYWFALTHGTVYMFATDVSDRENVRQVVPVDLALFDSSGRLLARAAGAAPEGAVFLTWPTEYACHGAERDAAVSPAAREEWERCFARLSQWVPTWIGSLNYVELRSGSCTIERIPVAATEYRDNWWLWWLPLVHVGGKPYTSYSISIQVDLVKCEAVR
jgi:hypothetical protein